MDEGSLFFDGKGRVQQTLRKITKCLNELQIPYAVAGGMCLFHYGFRRFTEDVDLLVTREGLNQIHHALEGLGFVRVFTGSKGMRDADTKVKIDFLIAGDYPGDGKPKPISFPEPSAAAEDYDGIRYLKLSTLITLKLASGLSNENRHKDIVDVEELTKALNLPELFADQLPPSIQDAYRQIWQRLYGKVKRFARIANPTLSVDAEVVAILNGEGVTVDDTKPVPPGCLYLVTTDPAIAQKYDFHPEEEFFI